MPVRLLIDFFGISRKGYSIPSITGRVRVHRDTSKLNFFGKLPEAFSEQQKKAGEGFRRAAFPKGFLLVYHGREHFSTPAGNRRRPVQRQESSD